MCLQVVCVESPIKNSSRNKARELTAGEAPNVLPGSVKLPHADHAIGVQHLFTLLVMNKVESFSPSVAAKPSQQASNSTTVAPAVGGYNTNVCRCMLFAAVSLSASVEQLLLFPCSGQITPGGHGSIPPSSPKPPLAGGGYNSSAFSGSAGGGGSLLGSLGGIPASPVQESYMFNRLQRANSSGTREHHFFCCL